MAYRISRRSDLLTKVVKKDVVDALLKTLQGLEPIDGITTRNVKELGDARSLLSAATSAEMANHVCGMVFDRFDDRTFDPGARVTSSRSPAIVYGQGFRRPADHSHFQSAARDDPHHGMV